YRAPKVPDARDRAAQHVTEGGDLPHPEQAVQVPMVGVDPLEVDPQRVVVRVEEARGLLVDDRVAGAEHAEPPVYVLPEVDGGEGDLPPGALAHAGVDVVERNAGELLERRGGFERGAVGDPLHAARRPGGRPAL